MPSYRIPNFAKEVWFNPRLQRYAKFDLPANIVTDIRDYMSRYGRLRLVRRDALIGVAEVRDALGDRPGDRARVALFAEAPEDDGELALVHRLEVARGREGDLAVVAGEQLRVGDADRVDLLVEAVDLGVLVAAVDFQSSHPGA